MRRTLFFAAATVVLLATGSLLFRTSLSTAHDAVRAAKADEAPPGTQLSIGQVVLFSSGVGYFQREGAVEGDARVDLSFPVSDINDLIKSMVLRDLDGGAISAVSIDSSAPTERTLRSFAIDLSRNPSFAEVLNQARGEKVEVALANAANVGAATLNGTIVGVEKQHQAVNKETVDVSVLNLWCADGMRGVKLADVQRVRFLNPVIDSEFKKALETLALSHDTQKKAVSIRFVGEGKRRVRVGYVIENPIWKTSYRLVLGSKEEEKPYLQGWAVVENPTDEDWREVRMALISGRPISFQMDLYTPLYVSRPVVVPELFQSLRPVAYSGSMEEDDRKLAEVKMKAERKQVTDLEFAPRAEAKTAPAMRGTSGRLAGAMGGKADFAEGLRKQLQQQMSLGDSVSTAASAAKLGDFFRYAIDKPVTLPRQKSALLPIVGKDVQASRVSIYNERTRAKFPLLGLRFKNTSGFHLMQGPITVFEGSTYAGDARILDLQPNEERLVSYAIDLGTEVNAVPSFDNGRVLAVKAVKGIVQTTTKNRQIKTYQIKNRNDSERTVPHRASIEQRFHTAPACKVEGDIGKRRLPLRGQDPCRRHESQFATEEHGSQDRLLMTTNSDGEQIKFFKSQRSSA